MSIDSSSPPSGEFPDVLVACVQMEPKVGHKAHNLAQSLQGIEQAAAQGAQIIVLPELANTGYVFQSRDEAFALAEPIPSGESTQAWLEAAARLNVHIVAGIAERDRDRLYNAAVTVGPDGYLSTYRKLHLWGDEHLYFESGDLGLPIVHTAFGRLATVICYDGWFPEVYRLVATLGADIVCMPTNWVPTPTQKPDRLAMANTLAMANAHSNGLNIVCANRIGTERGQPFIGQSLIVDADGWPVAGPASKDQPEVLVARLNVRRSRLTRHFTAFNNILRDRREDIYDPMLGTGWPLPRY